MLLRSSLREQALEVIRQRLVSGDLRPGRTYSAAALAQQLGTSTAPVREAMLTLVEQGIVRPVRNVGYEVVALTDHDLDEIHELRRMLEVPAVRTVAAVPDLDLTDAHAAAERCARGAEQGDVTEFLTRDREFHLEILRHADNQRLVGVVAMLRDQTRLYGLHGLAGGGHLVRFAAEHRDLLAAVEAGEGDLAARIMTDHLAHVRREWAGRPEP